MKRVCFLFLFFLLGCRLRESEFEILKADVLRGESVMISGEAPSSQEALPEESARQIMKAFSEIKKEEFSILDHLPDDATNNFSIKNDNQELFVFYPKEQEYFYIMLSFTRYAKIRSRPVKILLERLGH